MNGVWCNLIVWVHHLMISLGNGCLIRTSDVLFLGNVQLKHSIYRFCALVVLMCIEQIELILSGTAKQSPFTPILDSRNPAI